VEKPHEELSGAAMALRPERITNAARRLSAEMHSPAKMRRFNMYYSLIEKRLDGQIGKMHSPDAGKCSRESKF